MPMVVSEHSAFSMHHMYKSCSLEYIIHILYSKLVYTLYVLLMYGNVRFPVP